MTSIAEKLRLIRESLPNRPGVRAVASLLGYDVPNKYGYYESSQFKKDALPLDKAREIAAGFGKLGGDPAEVLALAGLSADEQRVEVSKIKVGAAEPNLLQMSVVFPNERELTDMFAGLLEAVDRPDLVDELAPRLAQLLPNGIARTLASSSPRRSGARPRQRDVAAPPPAKDRPERPSR
ncbi:hypothetical protein [Sphingomonas leidyi]|uniref:hypothetical protein n=1 Tax=Sphingomonas leidyi TaxID=68569 RepID=UPI0036D3452B